ncbi:PRP38 family-domain-containing protein [Chytriomyces sp. MP71]|nr:PRP38 family-domain-containing protein [Chytriomyces sp. MP71]
MGTDEKGGLREERDSHTASKFTAGPGEAHAIHGQNPMNLVEKIIRSRIHDSVYWKEHCFALTAETLVDKAVALHAVGGQSGLQKPSEFLCLTMRLLQLQPERAIVAAYLEQDHFKYLKALAAFYLRLTFRSIDVYNYLEPLLLDKTKLRMRDAQGNYYLSYMDEFADSLLRQDRVCDIILPRISKRSVLVEAKDLDERVSPLQEELEMMLQQAEEEEMREREQREAEEEEKKQQAAISTSGSGAHGDRDDQPDHMDVDEVQKSISSSAARYSDRDYQASSHGEDSLNYDPVVASQRVESKEGSKGASGKRHDGERERDGFSDRRRSPDRLRRGDDREYLSRSQDRDRNLDRRERDRSRERGSRRYSRDGDDGYKGNVDRRDGGRNRDYDRRDRDRDYDGQDRDRDSNRRDRDRDYDRLDRNRGYDRRDRNRDEAISHDMDIAEGLDSRRHGEQREITRGVESAAEPDVGDELPTSNDAEDAKKKKKWSSKKVNALFKKSAPKESAAEQNGDNGAGGKNGGGSRESMSIEETNKMRVALGLKPLKQ